MSEENSIGLRIKSLIDFYAGGNKSKFADIIGTNEANVRNYVNGRSPNIEIINTIVREFEISYEWLLIGKGEMFQKTEENEKYNTVCPVCIEKDNVIENQKERIDELKDTISILKEKCYGEQQGKRHSA